MWFKKYIWPSTGSLSHILFLPYKTTILNLLSYFLFVFCLFVLKMGSCYVRQTILNSDAQMIPLPQPPTGLNLQDEPQQRAPAFLHWHSFLRHVPHSFTSFLSFTWTESYSRLLATYCVGTTRMVAAIHVEVSNFHPISAHQHSTVWFTITNLFK